MTVEKENLSFFYFQEHHPSSQTKMSKEETLKQMPGFGALDYAPIMAALKEIKYDGLSEIFMHPVPRGIPVRDTPAKISGVINSSREYLTKLLS